MASLKTRILSRFLQAGDMSLQPPKWIVNAVDTGILDPKALAVWSQVVKTMATTRNGSLQDPGYGAATQYWRNKCAKMGITIVPDLIDSRPQGTWSVKTGDQVEDWVKQVMKTKGLLDETAKTAYQWEMEIKSLTDKLLAAIEKVENRVKHSGPSSKQPLSKLVAEVHQLKAALDGAEAELKRLQEQAERYNRVKSFSIEFEKHLQFLFLMATKDLDKSQVYEAASSALDKFMADVQAPDAIPVKMAGILDTIGGFLKKSWDWLTSAWSAMTGWVTDLKADTTKIENLLDQVTLSLPAQLPRILHT